MYPKEIIRSQTGFLTKFISMQCTVKKLKIISLIIIYLKVMGITIHLKSIILIFVKQLKSRFK